MEKCMYIIPYLYISTNIHTRAKLGNHTECRRTRKSNATPFFVCGERCFEIRCNNGRVRHPPSPGLGKKNVDKTTVFGWVNKISWGMPLETKMPTCKIDVTLIRTDPCQEQHVTLKHQKFHTDKNRRLPSSRRHRFCTWHHITGHLVFNKKKVCCSNPRVPSYATCNARKFRGWHFQVTQKVFEHHVFKDRET